MNKLTQLTRLGKQFNSLIDEGESIEIIDVCSKLESKRLFEWLECRFSDKLDLNNFDKTDITDIEEIFYQINKSSEPEDHEVISNGLCLLIAYCFVSIELTFTLKSQLS